jgi:hypothetical protein
MCGTSIFILYIASLIKSISSYAESEGVQI